MLARSSGATFPTAAGGIARAENRLHEFAEPPQGRIPPRGAGAQRLGGQMSEDQLAPAPTEEQRLRAEMIAIAAEFAPSDGVHATAIEPLQLIRASAPAEPLPAVYE